MNEKTALFIVLMPLFVVTIVCLKVLRWVFLMLVIPALSHPNTGNLALAIAGLMALSAMAGCASQALIRFVDDRMAHHSLDAPHEDDSGE